MWKEFKFFYQDHEVSINMTSQHSLTNFDSCIVPLVTMNLAVSVIQHVDIIDWSSLHRPAIHDLSRWST